jgi:8-oxo-dGTP pyrophosphatase MutT (NUDIX family)
MTFKQWLQRETAFVPTSPDDPELNGLVGLADYKPAQKQKTRISRLIDKLFGKIATETQRPQGAGVVCTDGESILLLLRSADSDNPKTWCVPGGGIEKNETPLEAAKRECREEIGRYCGVNFDKSREKDWTCFFNKVDRPFKCKLNREHTKWQWVPFSELKKYKLHPELKKKIDSYLIRIKRGINR